MAESNGYTKFPNWLLDEAMSKCDPNEWRVICVIVRETIGWGIDFVKLSSSELRTATGIAGKSTLIDAVNGLINKGYIAREESGMSYAYRLTSPISGLVPKQDMSQDRTSTGPEIGQDVVLNRDYLPPALKKERKLKKNIYAPTALNGNGKRYESSHFDKLLPCLVKAVKTPYGAGVNEDEFEQAIYTLIGWDVTPEQVEGFGEWWKTNGHYKGLPALKSFVAEFRNYLSGVKTNQGNGKTPDNTTWQRIVTAVTNGVFTGLSPDEKTALRAIGGLPVIKAMTPYDEPKLKSQFFQALGATV